MFSLSHNRCWPIICVLSISPFSGLCLPKLYAILSTVIVTYFVNDSYESLRLAFVHAFDATSDRGVKTWTSESQPQSASWLVRNWFQSRPYVNSEWCLMVSIASLLCLKSQIRVVKSYATEASELMENGENWIRRTAYSHPRSSKIGARRWRRSQPRIRPSEPPVARMFSSYLHQSHERTYMKYCCRKLGNQWGFHNNVNTYPICYFLNWQKHKLEYLKVKTNELIVKLQKI